MSNPGVVHVGTPSEEWTPEDRVILHFHNFKSMGLGGCLTSSEFTCAGRGWYLRLARGTSFVFAGLKPSSKSKVALGIEIFVRKRDGETVPNETRNMDEAEFPDPDPESRNSGGWVGFGCLFWEYKKLVRDKRDILTDGSLTLEVRMRPRPDYYYVTPQPTISEHVLGLISDKDGTDVAFQIGDKVFHAHQHVLKLRAPDFAADFCDACDKTNPLPIEDIKPEIFSIMRSHAYGKDISPGVWNKHTNEILQASGKYGFNTLKLEAEAWYMNALNLTVTNAIDELLYADSNNLSNLKKKVMDFVVANGCDIMASDTYVNLDQSPELRKEVMAAAFGSRKRSRED